MEENQKPRRWYNWCYRGLALLLTYPFMAYPAFWLVNQGFLPGATYRLFVPLEAAWRVASPSSMPECLKEIRQLEALRKYIHEQEGGSLFFSPKWEYFYPLDVRDVGQFDSSDAPYQL